LGVGTALKRGQWQDHVGTFLALLAVCTPGFVVGPVLIMLFAIHWRWFPVALWESPAHAVLPTITLGVYFAGKVARLMREGMQATLQAEFITTARAKGLSEAAVVMKHAFRLAVLPVVSYSGPLLADLLTGSFVVENLFQIPGIGVFMVNSSLNRDYPMVVGLVLLYAVLLLGLNLLVDLFYVLLDPRVKYA
jgi:oligopeptide transport system permease protein